MCPVSLRERGGRGKFDERYSSDTRTGLLTVGVSVSIFRVCTSMQWAKIRCYRLYHHGSECLRVNDSYIGAELQYFHPF